MSDKVTDIINKHKAKASTPAEKDLLDALFGDFEKTLEDVGQKGKFNDVVIDFLSEKSKEIKSLRCTRNVMISCGLLLSFLSLGVFFYVFLFPSSYYMQNMEESNKTTYIIASFTAGFGMIAVIIRGIFSANSSSDNNNILPENMRAFIDMISSNK